MGKDIGLEHIKKLHISSVRDARGIYNEFSRKYGQKRAREIMEDIMDAAKKGRKKDFYDKKNEDYDISMIFSGCYDADIIRKTCNWINDNKEVFGDEILEIGCDCGFVTTFLGTIFPDKHITAIDRSQAGIEIAKKNVERFGLTNIDFMCIDASEIKDKEFDTVFSMRTMQENGNFNEEDLSNELVVQANIFADEKQKYAYNISDLIKEGGNLISIERLGFNALFLAWIQVLTKAGLRIDLESYSEICCNEVGQKSTFESLVFYKQDCKDIDPFESFKYCYAKYNNMSFVQYQGWDAKIMYEFSGGELLEGVEVEDTINGAKSRVVCRKHKNDDTHILFYQNNNGNVELTYHEMSEKDDILNAIRNEIKQVEAINYIKIKKLND